ncbi:MAG: hypothetical protein EP338_04540 [Bacteroidetes bacterium]|nr:MAG: hypothetical protein EP338_04540 [Bacteroidota bacterium]
MSDQDHLEELKADPSRPGNQRRRVGMNGELIAAIVVLSISLVWLLFTWLVVRRIYTLNWIIMAIGVGILILGLIKYYRIKNNNLDF